MVKAVFLLWDQSVSRVKLHGCSDKCWSLTKTRLINWVAVGCLHQINGELNKQKLVYLLAITPNQHGLSSGDKNRVIKRHWSQSNRKQCKLEQLMAGANRASICFWYGSAQRWLNEQGCVMTSRLEWRKSCLSCEDQRLLNIMVAERSKELNSSSRLQR